MGFLKYKAVIFDLDGTLTDTLEDLTVSLNYALKENGYRGDRTQDEVRMFVGSGAETMARRALPGVNDVSDVIASFNKHYAGNCYNKTAPYSGIPELLAKLDEMKIEYAMVSNKPDYAVKEIAEKFFCGKFKVAVGQREGVPKKPAPDAVYYALSMLGIEKEQAVYIGDSDVDIKTAENCNMDCISVLWGFRTEAQLDEAGAKIKVHKPEEIIELLK